jgi:hypothetical protein
MNARMEIAEAFLKALPVRLPRHAVYPRSRTSLEREVRPPKKIDREMM